MTKPASDAPVLRVAVTDIDAWERWRSKSGGSDAEMISRLDRRDRRTNWWAEAGRAFHHALESPDGYRRIAGTVDAEVVVENRRRWRFRWAERCESEAMLAVPDATEFPLCRVYDLGEVHVELLGIVDATWGNIVGDYKLVFSPKGLPNRFADDFQWRALLDMMGKPGEYEFRHDVFYAAKVSETAVELRRHAAARWHWYAGLHDDVVSRLGDFAAWAERVGWDGKNKVFSHTVRGARDPRNSLEAMDLT